MLLNLVILKPNNLKDRDEEEDEIKVEIKVVESIHSNNFRRTTLDFPSKSTQSKTLIP